MRKKGALDVRSASNKNGSTEKQIDFPPPIGRDIKVSFPAAILCTASCCSFLSVTLSFCMSGLTRIQSCQPSHGRSAHNPTRNYGGPVGRAREQCTQILETMECHLCQNYTQNLLSKPATPQAIVQRVSMQRVLCEAV